MANDNFLAALQDPYLTGGDTYSGIGAGAVAGSLPYLVDPYGSTGSNALNVFGGSILAALLGNMAKSDAAEQNAGIVSQQSQFLKATPAERLTMTQQDPRTFAKLQAALNTNQILQEQKNADYTSQLTAQQPFEIEKENRALENKRKELMQIKLAENEMFGGDPLKNPESPQYKINQNIIKEEDAARSEIAKIPSVSQFASMQKSLPLVKAFKDPNTKSSDVGFVYNYIKSLDDGAVRGEEINMAAASNPLVLKYQNQLQGAIDGTSELTPALKNQMYKELEAAQGGVYAQALLDANRRFDIAKSRGVTEFGRVLPFDANLTFGEAQMQTRLTARDFAERAKADGVPMNEAMAAWEQYKAENP
jgi:hypothetical protein